MVLQPGPCLHRPLHQCLEHNAHSGLFAGHHTEPGCKGSSDVHSTCGALAWSPPSTGLCISACSMTPFLHAGCTSGCRTPRQDPAVQTCQSGVAMSNPADGKRASCTNVRRPCTHKQIGPIGCCGQGSHSVRAHLVLLLDAVHGHVCGELPRGHISARQHQDPCRAHVEPVQHLRSTCTHQALAPGTLPLICHTARRVKSIGLP